MSQTTDAATRARTSRFDLPLAAILVLAAVLRLVVLLIRSANGARFVRPDSVGYLTLAKHLHAFTSSSSPEFGLSMLRTPVYPLYLAATQKLTGSELVGPMVIQIVLGLVLIYLTYRFTIELFDRRAALLAALALSVDPMSIIYSSIVLTEILYALLLLGSLQLLRRSTKNQRWTTGLAAGVLLGLATLTRPISIYLPVVLIVGYLAVPPRQARSAAAALLAFLLGFGLLAGGWVVRNAVMGHVATISTIGAVNILEFRAADALVESGQGPLGRARNELDAEVARRLPSHPTPGEIDKAQESVGLRVIRHHMVGYVKEAAKGVGRLLFGPGSAELKPAVGEHDTRLVDVYSAVYLVGAYLVAAIGLAVVVTRQELRKVTLPILATIYIVAVSAGFEAYSRFRVPIMPYIALFGGVGGAWLLAGLERRSGRVRADAL